MNSEERQMEIIRLISLEISRYRQAYYHYYSGGSSLGQDEQEARMKDHQFTVQFLNRVREELEEQFFGTIR